MAAPLADKLLVRQKNRHESLVGAAYDPAVLGHHQLRQWRAVRGQGDGGEHAKALLIIKGSSIKTYYYVLENMTWIQVYDYV